MIVESGGLGWEDRIVVHNIERVGAQRKVTFCSNDGSDGIANPFVRPLRELQCIEGLYWEGETMDPMPIGRMNIEVSSKRHGVRERRIDLDLKRSSRGRDEAMMREKSMFSLEQ